MELNIPDNYFEDEEREGFLIKGMMKRCFAAQMKLLCMVAEIFKRHGLVWWADYGTLLGAVRHRGYVPWDDDLDISMPRADYEIGIEALKAELPSYCAVLKIIQDPPVPWSVVWNRKNTDMGEGGEAEWITREFFGVPYVCTVDIHPLDYIPKDPGMREYFFQLTRLVDVTAYYYYDYQKEGTLEGWLKNIEEGCGSVMPMDRDCKLDLYFLLDRISQAFSREESCGLAMVDEWATRGRKIRPLECHDGTVVLPFEMIEMPVPVGYKRLLDDGYGDWCRPVKGATHEYPFYKSQEDKIRQSGVKRQ